MKTTARINMTISMTFRNSLNEYLFIAEHSHDNSSTHLVLTDRNGEIIRSYDLPLSLENCSQVVQKAGWRKVDF